MIAGGKNRAACQLFRGRGRCPGGLCAGPGALSRDQAATSVDDLQPAEEHAHENSGEIHNASVWLRLDGFLE